VTPNLSELEMGAVFRLRTAFECSTVNGFLQTSQSCCGLVLLLLVAGFAKDGLAGFGFDAGSWAVGVGCGILDAVLFLGKNWHHLAFAGGRN
jgi:hypothetical protein